MKGQAERGEMPFDDRNGEAGPLIKTGEAASSAEQDSGDAEQTLEETSRTGSTSARVSLVRGAVLLGLAAVVSKLIGTLQKIPLQNLAGDAVFGIYNVVYPLYTLILFLATAGFPIVVSNFVASCAAEGRKNEARQVLRVAAWVLSGTGLLFFLLLYFGAETLARWLGAEQTTEAIRGVSFALLVVPVMSALRGYFQGFQEMGPTAWSQVVEQTIRVITMFTLLMVFMQLGSPPERIAAGAMFGSVTGALAGLAVMLWYWRRERATDGLKVEVGQADQAVQRMRWQDRLLSDWKLARRLTVYALPLCLGSLAMPILGLVDSFTLPRLLAQSGRDELEVLVQYGLYNHGQPMVQLVAMIAASMTAALVPAIAAAKHRDDVEAVRSRAQGSLRLSLLIGLAASFGLAGLAEPLNVMFFKSAEGTTAMRVLSFTAVLSAVNLVASSVLQGLGAVRAPALYLLAAALAKLALNAALVPRYGIDGAAWAAVCAYALAAALSLRHAMRAAGVPAPRGHHIMMPMLSIAIMMLGLLAVTHGLASLLARLPLAMPARGMAAVVALSGVAVGVLAYALALKVLRVVNAQELALASAAWRKLRRRSSRREESGGRRN